MMRHYIAAASVTAAEWWARAEVITNEAILPAVLPHVAAAEAYLAPHLAAARLHLGAAANTTAGHLDALFAAPAGGPTTTYPTPFGTVTLPSAILAKNPELIVALVFLVAAAVAIVVIGTRRAIAAVSGRLLAEAYAISLRLAKAQGETAAAKPPVTTLNKKAARAARAARRRALASVEEIYAVIAESPAFDVDRTGTIAPAEGAEAPLGLGDAASFPFTGSLVLFSLYVLVKLAPASYVSALIGSYLGGFGVLAVFAALLPWLGARPQRRNVSASGATGDLKEATAEAKAKPASEAALAGAARALFAARYLVTGAARTTSAAAVLAALATGYAYFIAGGGWIATNVLSVSIAVVAIEAAPVGQFPVAALLLCGLFFYDIFWVFGTDVMVKVATSIDGPIKILFPQAALTGRFDSEALLGLGDIVIPGFLIAMLGLFGRYKGVFAAKERLGALVAAEVARAGAGGGEEDGDGNNDGDATAPAKDDAASDAIAVPAAPADAAAAAAAKGGTSIKSKGGAAKSAAAAASQKAAISAAEEMMALAAVRRSILALFAPSLAAAAGPPSTADARTADVRPSGSYLVVAVLAYACSLVHTMAVMILFNHAQPALLFIVPWLLVTTVAWAVVKGELGLLWRFNTSGVNALIGAHGVLRSFPEPIDTKARREAAAAHLARCQ